MYTIDLHGIPFLHDALEQLEHDLFFAYKKNYSVVRVIHGIGTGKLAQAVQEALDKNPMVKKWELEYTDGSCLVEL